MARASKAITFILAGVVLSCAGAAAEEHVVVGKRTYMSSFPFFGC
jgi:hypothetical protein